MTTHTPQQQQQRSKDEEEGGEALLHAYTGAGRQCDTGKAAVAGGPEGSTFNEEQPEEELLFIAPVPTASSTRGRRSILLRGRAAVATLKVVWSTATATAALVGALLATLVFFWALYPVCTSCVRSRRSKSAALVGAAAAAESGRSTLYINQLQVIGTHNSYHRRTYVPALSEYWDYDYPSLTAQLDAGIRHLELDIHYDWKTGRWFVFHLSVLDPMTSCSCLSACLEEIREWSDVHPAHHILFIEIELKLTGDFLRLCGQKTPDADHAAFRAMQETVVDEFSAARILTPRQVRGDYETLTEAIRTASSFSKYSSSSSSSSSEEKDRDGSNSSGGAERELKGGWPLVDDTRGMVLFVIDYQTANLLCRPAVRKALPADETIFFERTPLDDVNDTSLLAFAETRISGAIDQLVRQGVIVRDEGEPRPTYIVDSPAQLMVWDDLRPVQHSSTLITQQQENGQDHGGLPPPLPCRTRCSSLVPKEQCVLEGFC
eukprot:g18340.t2